MVHIIGLQFAFAEFGIVVHTKAHRQQCHTHIRFCGDVWKWEGRKEKGTSGMSSFSKHNVVCRDDDVFICLKTIGSCIRSGRSIM